MQIVTKLILLRLMLSPGAARGRTVSVVFNTAISIEAGAMTHAIRQNFTVVMARRRFIRFDYFCMERCCVLRQRRAYIVRHFISLLHNARQGSAYYGWK